MKSLMPQMFTSTVTPAPPISKVTHHRVMNIQTAGMEQKKSAATTVLKVKPVWERLYMNRRDKVVYL